MIFYVLVITTSVYSGTTYAMQEFANKQSCENAVEVLKSKNPLRFAIPYQGRPSPVSAFCIPKDVTTEIK